LIPETSFSSGPSLGRGRDRLTLKTSPPAQEGFLSRKHPVGGNLAKNIFFPTSSKKQHLGGGSDRGELFFRFFSPQKRGGGFFTSGREKISVRCLEYNLYGKRGKRNPFLFRSVGGGGKNIFVDQNSSGKKKGRDVQKGGKRVVKEEFLWFLCNFWEKAMLRQKSTGTLLGALQLKEGKGRHLWERSVEGGGSLLSGRLYILKEEGLHQCR